MILFGKILIMFGKISVTFGKILVTFGKILAMFGKILVTLIVIGQKKLFSKKIPMRDTTTKT